MPERSAATDHADWVFPHGVTGISSHALFRYRTRVDRRCGDPISAIIQDLGRGVPRRTPPRWAHLHSQPADFHVAADDLGPARVYPVRDGLVVTVLVRPAERSKHHRSGGRARP
jgi:hypothetical protein